MSPSPEPARIQDASIRRTIWILSALLAALTLAVFGQTIGFGFVNFDDVYYVYENPVVTNGLTWHGVGQAFAHGSPANWDPLTTLSHMADCQIYGLNAGGHHLTNVLLHTASVVLLFLVLHRMTGAVWRSAVVAALFAIHPLRVESVAWVTERKDVLSGLFFMLTLGAYVRYVRQPWRLANYLLVLLFFVLGLMSKAMLVTLPFLLLLLDYWPLNRFASATPGTVRRLILEKMPLVALTVLSLVITVIAQGKSVRSSEAFPLPMRAGNMVVSYVTYIIQLFYPAKLAVFYPYPAHGQPVEKIALGLAALGAVSAAVLVWRRKYPFVLTGWLWYLGMLTPVIGIVQLGAQSHADRYTYLPQIGLYLALAWGGAKLGASARGERFLLPGVAAVICLLGIVAFRQCTYWRDSESLWRRALASTSDNALAHYNLAMTIAPKGSTDEAIAEFKSAIAIQPDYVDALNNLGDLLAQHGRTDEAIDVYRKALQTQPSDAMIHFNLGAVLNLKGRRGEAIDQIRQALEIQPNDADAQDTLGGLLLQAGSRDEAIVHFCRALEIQPSFLLAQEHLARIAWILATHPNDANRNGTKALEIAALVSRSSGGNKPEHLAVLAAAQAETGDFVAASQTTVHALQLATAQSNAALTNALQMQLSYYRSNRPYRQPGQTNTGAAN